MDRTITKQDDFTMNITGTTPYEQDITKDQLNARIAELDSNIAWFNVRIAELEASKIEVQNLLTEAENLGILTRDEWQALQPEVPA